MRILRKINKGLILTIIVLVILVIYLIQVEKQRKKQEPEIQEACKEYIEVINKNIVLPEKYQQINIELSEEEFKAEVEEKIEEQLKQKMIDNEVAIEIQKDILVSEIQEKNQNAQVITSYKKEITKFKKMKFDGDQVTVTIETKVEVNTKYLEDATYNPETNKYEGTKETNKINTFTTKGYDEQIILQNIDGEWKIVNSDLQYQDNTASKYYDTQVVEF